MKALEIKEFNKKLKNKNDKKRKYTEMSESKFEAIKKISNRKKIRHHCSERLQLLCST